MQEKKFLCLQDFDKKFHVFLRSFFYLIEMKQNFPVTVLKAACFENVTATWLFTSWFDLEDFHSKFQVYCYNQLALITYFLLPLEVQDKFRLISMFFFSFSTEYLFLWLHSLPYKNWNTACNIPISFLLLVQCFKWRISIIFWQLVRFRIFDEKKKLS